MPRSKSQSSVDEESVADKPFAEVSTNYRTPAIFCLCFLLPFAFYSWKSGVDIWVPAIFTLGVIATLPLLLIDCNLRIDQKQIEVRSMLDHKRMLWKDVQRVEIDEQGMYLTFFGENQLLTLSGPMGWKGEVRGEMLRFIYLRCKARGILFSTHTQQKWRRCKNVQVSRK